MYVNKGKQALPEREYVGWERLSNKKLFIDEIYQATIVKPIEGLGRAGKMFDKEILTPFTDFVGIGAEDTGKSMKRFQNGNVENYVLIMSLAIGIILIVNFILQ
jgi:NADH-quinone oxidoreductase subunit L